MWNKIYSTSNINTFSHLTPPCLDLPNEDCRIKSSHSVQYKGTVNTRFCVFCVPGVEKKEGQDNK